MGANVNVQGDGIGMVQPEYQSHRPILVVDDDAQIREIMRELLELEGYPVEVAQDGDEALQRLHSGLCPCLILLDLNMPVKDGFQFRREQLADGRLAAIPTIAWSGGDDQQYSARLNGTPFLRKGVDVGTLLTCIEAHRQKA